MLPADSWLSGNLASVDSRAWSSSSLQLHPCPDAASSPGAQPGAGAVLGDVWDWGAYGNLQGGLSTLAVLQSCAAACRWAKLQEWECQGQLPTAMEAKRLEVSPSPVVVWES